MLPSQFAPADAIAPADAMTTDYSCYLCQLDLNGETQFKEHVGRGLIRSGKANKHMVALRMNDSKFVLPLNGASDTEAPWIVGARNCLYRFKPARCRVQLQCYECLHCGHRLKKWTDMIKHLQKEPECADVAELMRSRRSEMALLGQQLDIRGIRFSSTRCGSRVLAIRRTCWLLLWRCTCFCPLHAYCPLCHVWQPSNAIWVDEDCCAYGKCRMGSLCGFCEGVLETKNEQTQQAALILQQKFGRPLRIVAKEGGAEVPLEPVRGSLPGALGKEPERVVRSWMVMPYPELCPWPVEKP